MSEAYFGDITKDQKFMYCSICGSVVSAWVSKSMYLHQEWHERGNK